MFYIIEFLIIIVFQLAIFTTAYLQSKRTDKKIIQTLNIPVLWGIAICSNLLHSVLLFSLLKMDWCGENIYVRENVAVFSVLALTETVLILLRHIKQKKFKNSVAYIFYLIIIGIAVAIIVLMMYGQYYDYIIYMVAEVNFIPIVADINKGKNKNASKKK